MKDQMILRHDPSRLRRSFARGLQSYHENASVQAQIATDLVSHLLAQGGGADLGRVLEFGCGTGHLTDALLNCFNINDLTLNDLVPETGETLNRLLQERQQSAQFRFGAVESIVLEGQYDLIASASTVQWIEDLPSALARFSQHLTPGGWLTVSGFGRQQFHQLAALGSDAAAPSYLDAEEWEPRLPPDLELIFCRQRAIDLQFSSAMELLRHLRLTGVNGQASQRWGRRDLQRFDDQYRQRFGENGRLPLTYDAVWVLAQKRQ